MKDHKEVTRYVEVYEKLPVEEFCKRVLETADGLINPKIDLRNGYDYDLDIVITGYLPLTEKELEAKKRAAAKAKEAAAKRKEREKIKAAEQVAKLLEKYPEFRTAFNVND